MVLDPFTPKESPFDEQNRLALDRVKSIESLVGVKGLTISRKETLISFSKAVNIFTGASQRLEPVIKCCLFLSFFQCLVSRAPLSAVAKSLSE